MPDYRFVYGASDNKPSSGYAGRIPYEIWSQFEAVIRQMYAQGSTREDILGTLKEQHEFQPSWVTETIKHSTVILTSIVPVSYEIR